jgi:DNA-binding protein WhiA
MFAARPFTPEHVELRADTTAIGAHLRALLSDVFGIACAEGVRFTISLPSEIDTIFGELGEGAHLALNRGAFGCELCRQAFLRGAFVECGTVNAPGHACHLEFSVSDDGRCTELAMLLSELGQSPGITLRRRTSSAGIYFKGGEAVEDILNLIGAQKAAFALMDAKIVRELRNNANRCANCDAANIYKTVDAAQNQIEAISRVLASGSADIAPELLETARLRTENPDATLSELAALHIPPLTKSGVKPRLDRIQKLF